MMRLATSTNFAVELCIVGYQFPDSHSAEYDSNWLVIKGQVRHPRGNWNFREPCLLTYEAAQLADWLESVAADCETSSDAGFIEPNLAFEVVTAEFGRILRIIFSAESRPPWASQGVNVILEFPVAELNIAEAIREWRDQLWLFPQRAKC
jgi:hypothetical protein